MTTPPIILRLLAGKWPRNAEKHNTTSEEQALDPSVQQITFIANHTPSEGRQSMSWWTSFDRESPSAKAWTLDLSKSRRMGKKKQCCWLQCNQTFIHSNCLSVQHDKVHTHKTRVHAQYQNTNWHLLDEFKHLYSRIQLPMKSRPKYVSFLKSVIATIRSSSSFPRSPRYFFMNWSEYSHTGRLRLSG